MSKLETNTIDNISGSSTLKIGDTNATTLDFDTGITSVTNLPTDLKNTPAFLVAQTSNQSIATSTDTKITYNSVVTDSDSYWDATNYRWKPLVAGTYYMFAHIRFATDTDFQYAQLTIKKNGTVVALSNIRSEYYDMQYAHTIRELDGVDDYIEAFAYQTRGATLSLDAGGANYTITFGGFKIF